MVEEMLLLLISMIFIKEMCLIVLANTFILKMIIPIHFTCRQHLLWPYGFSCLGIIVSHNCFWDDDKGSYWCRYCCCIFVQLFYLLMAILALE